MSARRVGFVLGAVLLLAGPVVAHEPIRKQLLSEPPPGSPPPPTPPPISAADLAPDTSGETAVTRALRPLRELAAEASAVAIAECARTEVLDDGRLHVYRLHVERVLRGRLEEPEPAVVDIRGDSRRAPLLADGERMVVLLRPSPPLSYLTEHLPPGTTALVTVSGRDGILPVSGEADVDAIEHALTVGATLRADDVAGRRKFAFDELATASPVLVTDGLAEIDHLGPLGPLTPTERDVLGRALANKRVDQQTRIGLISVVGARSDASALPALGQALVDGPPVLDALLVARARLGAPAGRAELGPYLESQDAGLRAAAVRALANVQDPNALADLGRYATSDKNLNVRTAAIDALGATHRPEAVPLLAKTFADPAREVKQRSAQAIIMIGGPASDSALRDLALKGESSETREYAALVLLMTHGRDSDAVRQLEAANPGADVKHVLEHGLEFRDTHKHQ